jgi:hypothetical protein
MRVSVLTILMAFLLAAGIPFGAMAQDTDGDTVPDGVDNCRLVRNGDIGEPPGALVAQCDTDSDGYGNACDGDVDNSGIIGLPDYPAIDNNIGGTTPPGADTNCDGVIGLPDYPIIDNNIGSPPGPSGRWCAGQIPCNSVCCPVCGNAVCEGDESQCNCSADCTTSPTCSSCLAYVPVCGDGTCDLCALPAESHENCPADCALGCQPCP